MVLRRLDPVGAGAPRFGLNRGHPGCLVLRRADGSTAGWGGGPSRGHGGERDGARRGCRSAPGGLGRRWPYNRDSGHRGGRTVPCQSPDTASACPTIRPRDLGDGAGHQGLSGLLSAAEPAHRQVGSGGGRGGGGLQVRGGEHGQSSDGNGGAGGGGPWPYGRPSGSGIQPSLARWSPATDLCGGPVDTAWVIHIGWRGR